MTENTKVGRELYYLIEDITKNSLWRNEYSDHSREEFEERCNDHYSELSEELFFQIVEYLHTKKSWYNPASTSSCKYMVNSTLVDRSVFIREVTSPNEPTKKGGSQ